LINPGQRFLDNADEMQVELTALGSALLILLLSGLLPMRRMSVRVYRADDGS
jgi:hypothetical protein